MGSPSSFAKASVFAKATPNRSEDESEVRDAVRTRHLRRQLEDPATLAQSAIHNPKSSFAKASEDESAITLAPSSSG